MNDQFFMPDTPINAAERDRFNRAGFAKGIASTLVSLKDPSSIVIGIYGLWGEGKTSVLNLIKTELEQTKNILVLTFNPWRFVNEEVLLLSFFQALSGKVGVPIDTLVEKTARQLKKITDVTGGENLAAALADVDTETYKKRIEATLQKKKQRLVVIMDDIDRLDLSEIHAVFRLVKLTCGFDYIAYVLAFDEDMVAAALNQRYASPKESGRSFIEKIVQVPLHLPKAERESLRKYCFDCLDESLEISGVKLTTEEKERFDRAFRLALERRIDTPRMCKRYANATAFALNILRHEVNTVDLLLIEGLRVFYPSIYEHIRHKKEMVLGLYSLAEWKIESGEQTKNELINSLMKDLEITEGTAVGQLLRQLFPRIGTTASDNPSDREQENLADGQQVGSADYFDRYFSYAIPSNELPDEPVIKFLTNLDQCAPGDISAHITNLVTDKGLDEFIRKVSRRKTLLSSLPSPLLALEICRLGELFHDAVREQNLWGNSSTELFVRQLIVNTSKFMRPEVVKHIVLEAQPVAFADGCLRCFQLDLHQESWAVRHGYDDGTDASEPLLSDELLAELNKMLCARIRECLSEPIFLSLGAEDAVRLLKTLRMAHTKDEISDLLILTDPATPYANAMIRWYFGSRLGEVAKLSYGFLDDIVEPDLLYRRVCNDYGNEWVSSAEDAQFWQHSDPDQDAAGKFVREYLSRKKKATALSTAE